MKYIILNNGIEIPPIGLGTSNPIHDVTIPQVKNLFFQRVINFYYSRIYFRYKALKFCISMARAFKMGYRLIDTSAAYGNEKYIKWAIKFAKIKREELFITTRVSNHQQWAGNIKESFLNSMRALGLDYVDLYMFHWPVPDVFESTWKQMEELYTEGLVKAIGVANCHQHHLEILLKSASVVPMINQFEIHPLMSQKPLVDFCKTKGIAVEAYTPIGRNHKELMNDGALKQISAKYNKTIPQVILRWHYQNDIIPIPRSTNTKRLKQNISIFDFNLTPAEMESIDTINIDMRLRYDPDNCDFSRL